MVVMNTSPSMVPSSPPYAPRSTNRSILWIIVPIGIVVDGDNGITDGDVFLFIMALVLSLLMVLLVVVLAGCVPIHHYITVDNGATDAYVFLLMLS